MSVIINIAQGKYFVNTAFYAVHGKAMKKFR